VILSKVFRKVQTMADNKRAPLASIDDFSSICYNSPSTNKKSLESSTPLLKKGDKTNHTEIAETHDNAENIAKCNANRKLRPLVKVPGDRSVLNLKMLYETRSDLLVNYIVCFYVADLTLST